MSLKVIPAYGRDYKSSKAARAAWADGKDFQIADMSSPWDGSYVNKADLVPGEEVIIRYAGLRKQCIASAGGAA